MLKIIIGTEQVQSVLGYDPHMIAFPSKYFDNVHEQEWFNDPFVKKIAREIDNADVLAPDVLQDRVTKRTFASEHLSSGARYLMMVYKRNDLVYRATMGDNCCDLFEQIVAYHEKHGQDVLMIANYLHYFQFKYIDTIKYLNWDITCHSEKDICTKVTNLFIEQECASSPDEGLTEEEIEYLNANFDTLGLPKPEDVWS